MVYTQRTIFSIAIIFLYFLLRISPKTSFTGVCTFRAFPNIFCRMRQPFKCSRNAISLLFGTSGSFRNRLASLFKGSGEIFNVLGKINSSWKFFNFSRFNIYGLSIYCNYLTNAVNLKFPANRFYLFSTNCILALIICPHFILH